MCCFWLSGSKYLHFIYNFKGNTGEIIDEKLFSLHIEPATVKGYDMHMQCVNTGCNTGQILNIPLLSFTSKTQKYWRLLPPKSGNIHT